MWFGVACPGFPEVLVPFQYPGRDRLCVAEFWWSQPSRCTVCCLSPVWSPGSWLFGVAGARFPVSSPGSCLVEPVGAKGLRKLAPGFVGASDRFLVVVIGWLSRKTCCCGPGFPGVACQVSPKFWCRLEPPFEPRVCGAGSEDRFPRKCTYFFNLRTLKLNFFYLSGLKLAAKRSWKRIRSARRDPRNRRSPPRRINKSGAGWRAMT